MLALAKQLAYTWVGIVFTIGVAIHFVLKWFRRQKLTPAQREHEDIEKKAEEEGLTEIMVCAANGDLERILELVEYGGNVNARSVTGTTALMYAARNNHLPIIDYLISAGADPKLKSDKNSTAADIANKFSHVEIVKRLESQLT